MQNISRLFSFQAAVESNNLNYNESIECFNWMLLILYSTTFQSEILYFLLLYIYLAYVSYQIKIFRNTIW